MANTVETLYPNDWLSLKKMTLPDNKTNTEYVYSHETRCNGKIVVILPFRIIKDKLEFLLRSEVVPCWDAEHESKCALTGGLDTGKSPGEMVVEELHEEAGYVVTKNQLIPLGQCRGTKSSDTTFIIFSVDLSDKEITDPSKEEGHCFWTDDINESVDPVAYVAHSKVMDYLTTGPEE